MSCEQADRLKEEGNALFKADDILGAFMKYNQAHAQLPAIDNANEGDRESLLYKRAVLLSNRSNCLFEMGKYGKSSEDSRNCVGLLDDVHSKCEGGSTWIQQCHSLRWKNLLRIARCGVYGGDLHKEDSSAYDENILDSLHELEKCGDKAYEKRAKRMLAQVRPLREATQKRRAEGSTVPLPLIHRSSLYGSWVGEYYNYGHDVVTSALKSGYLENEDEKTPPCPAIELSKLPDEHLSNLSFLFGGVGDARHVYTTLCDVHKQWSELSEEKRKKLSVCLVLNDINATALSRDVLMMAGMVRLLRLAPTLEACRDTNSEAFRLATALQYIFFGYANPEPVHDSVMSLIDDLLREDFTLVKEFMTASDNNWRRIREIMQYWRNAKEGEDCFPTTAYVLDDVFNAQPRDTENPYTGVGHLTDMARDQISSNRERNRQEKEQMLAQIEDMTLESFGDSGLIDTIRHGLPPSERNNEAKLLEIAKSLMFSHIDEYDASELAEERNGGGSAGRFVDKQYVLEINAILPPKGYAAPMYDIIREQGSTDVFNPVRLPLIKKTKRDVRENWKVNRTMFDPAWSRFQSGRFDENRFNPVAEIGTDFLHAYGVLDYCESSVDKIEALDFYECTSLFLWSTARALVNLTAARAVSIELNLGSITDLGRSIQDGGSGRKFHRILLSNIFDYIGMLTAFTEVAPLLHHSTTTVSSFIQCNVLYNTSIWQDYSHYCYSSTGIPTLDEVHKILGLRHMNSDSVWIHQNQWTWSKEKAAKASRKELTSWLHRLLLICLLPPKRESRGISDESCPQNCATFLRTCVFCVEVLGYPSHWISGVLDEIISACSTSGSLKTTADISFSSPISFRAERSVHKIDMTPFRLELMSQIGLWMNSYGEILVPLATLPSSGQCRKYRLNLFANADEPPMEVDGVAGGLGCGGKPFKMCLGFVLSSRLNPDGTDLTDETAVFMANVCPWAPGVDKGKIRSAAIKGDSAIHVFSCMTFDRDRSTERYFIEFWMNEGDFQQYSDYYIYVHRTDTWNQVGLYREDAVMRLREAKCVS